MPKLYFRYGTMNSSKTANLLMSAHNYQSQGKKIIFIKPNIDDRFGQNIISSRIGIDVIADHVIDRDFNLIDCFDENNYYQNVMCVFVDECQFLSANNVEQLRVISLRIPVICYGLRTDYQSNLFEGSKRLMELADSIEEIKTICVTCNKKSIINAKFHVENGSKKIIKSGAESIDLGSEEKYQSMCYSCWYNDN